MAFTPLSDLPVGRVHCAICVRIVRLWDYCGNKEDQLPLHVDIVMVDEKGNRMYAEIPGAEANKFKSQINEGHVYVFRKFVVTTCKAAYKPFRSTQMIRFTPWSTVEEKPEMADKLPKYVFDLVEFEDLPSRVGQVEYFVDIIGIVVGVSEVVYVHLPSNQSSTAKRVIALKDLRSNQINLVLWGSRAIDFDAEGVHSIGQDSPVVTIFVGLLVKSYKGEDNLSGGSACKWYINEEIPEIESFFERMIDVHSKIKWISAGEQQFRGLEQQNNQEEMTVVQLRDMDPWEVEGTGYRCTVTITRISDKQPWWFSSCTKCHRASVPSGDKYKCSGGCPCTAAEPKYRLSLIGTDGTGTAEFTLFGRVARQVVGKPVISLIRSASKNQYRSSGDEFEHMVPELAALVSQKFTFSVSIGAKNLTQRNVSFQVNGIVAFFGKQAHIPRVRDPDHSHGATSSTAVAVENSAVTGKDDRAPTKKARLDRKAIPCRRPLIFDTDESVADKTSMIGMKENAENMTTAELPVLCAANAGSSNAVVNPFTEDSVVAVVSEDSEADKNPEIPRGTLKQRANTGRKKGNHI